jgi:hypothetical protein
MTAPPITAPNRVRNEFLFLHLETCTRCRGTDWNLESALASIRELLVATGAEGEVSRIHVESAEQARELRFRSSPTIRVNGQDIALELRESSCGSEACTDGCGEALACRVWVHGGREQTEPPVALILDAILREASGGTAGGPEPRGEDYGLPENLERVFAGQGVGTAATENTGVSATVAACCAPGERLTCCESVEKADCCGATSDERCGCR